MNSIRMTLRNLSLLAALALCASASAEDAAQPAAQPSSAATAPAAKTPAAATKAPAADAPVVTSAPPAAGKKTCEDVKAEIEAKLKAKGVKAFTLDIVPSADVKDAKVVGNCAGGSRKITYQRG